MRASAAVLFLVAILLPAALPAPPASAATEGTGLPLPRFVSLRAGKVFMRAGPGVQYPVEWEYHRQNLPVEVIAEYRTWRKVRDWQGTQGWVHQSMLGGRRTFIVIADVGTIRSRAEAVAAPVARADKGVVGDLLECPNGGEWCLVESGGFKGWLRRIDFWGIHRDEVIE